MSDVVIGLAIFGLIICILVMGWCFAAFLSLWVNRPKQGWQNPPVNDAWVEPRDRWRDDAEG